MPPMMLLPTPRPKIRSRIRIGTPYRSRGDRTGRQNGGRSATRMRDPSSGALILRLDRGRPGEYLFLIRADENVLFFLDKEGNALVGNSSHSYTLNRRAR